MSASASASAPSPPAGGGGAPAPAPAQVPFYCYGCEATVSVPAPARPPLCPRCFGDFLEESPGPFASAPSPPPPPPGFLSGSGSSSSSDEADDDDGLAGMDPAAARAYLSRLINHRLYDAGDRADVAAAAAAAVSVLQHGHRGGGEPPAPADSIAALPTVEISEPAAACAICKDDLPPASAATRLPCAHLYHSACIVTWLELHNSCPVCRFRLPSAHEAAPSDQDPPPTRITIRFTTTPRRRARISNDGLAIVTPVSASPTQLAQAVTGDGAGGPANSGETVSSEWPPHPESDTVMSEAREGDGFFDGA